MAYYGCSDGGCIFGHPGGMHTNGGCHCIDMHMSPDDMRKVKAGIKQLRDENKKLKKMLTEVLKWLEPMESTGGDSLDKLTAKVRDTLKG